MKFALLLIFSILIIKVSSQDQLSINYNLSENKADYYSTIIYDNNSYFVSTFQRNHETNDFGQGLEILSIAIDGGINWIYQKFPSTNDEDFLGEEENMILHDNKLYCVYSIINDESNKEILFIVLTPEGEEIISKRLAIEGNLSLAGGIISFKESIYILCRSTESEIKLLQLDENYNIVNTFTHQAPIANDIYLAGSDSEILISYSSWDNFNNEFNCLILDEDLEIKNHFVDFSVTETLSNISAIKTSDDGYLFTWVKDLSSTLYDTFPYPTVLYKFNKNLEMEWEYTFINLAAKQFSGVIENENGDIFGYGASDKLYAFDIPPFPLNLYSGWCFLIDKNGDLKWERNIFDKRYELFSSFHSGKQIKNGFALVGLVDDYDINSNPVNDPSAWLLSLDQDGCWNKDCSEDIIIDNNGVTEVKSLKHNTIRIYPTLISDHLKIISDEPIRYFRVISSEGIILFNTNNYEDQKTINCKSLNSGLYFLQIFDKNRELIFTEKFIKL